MAKATLMINPGNPDLRKVCENTQGKCVGQSLMFDDDKEKSGFLFKDKDGNNVDVHIPAGTKVHISAWSNMNKNGKPYFGVQMESFEDAWKRRQAAKAKKSESPGEDPTF
tara:strand:+ start:162 stop:491 length:330 start_codon:yes stop_codon:yes gene_type:complete